MPEPGGRLAVIAGQREERRASRGIASARPRTVANIVRHALHFSTGVHTAGVAAAESGDLSSGHRGTSKNG